MLDIRECKLDELGMLERDMPTGEARVHAAHFETSRTGASSYLVAWEFGTALGCVAILWNGPVGDNAVDRYPGVPEVAHLHVVVEARRRGIGTALITQAETSIRAKGYSTCVIGVDVSDYSTKLLYQRLGYVETPVEDSITYEYVSPGGERRTITEKTVLLVKDRLIEQ